MKSIRLPASKGFTLIEVAVVIVVIGLLASFGIYSFVNTTERRDAAMIQSAQATLQTIVSQGSVRMDMRPDALNTAAVINAANATLANNANSSNIAFDANNYPYRLSINSSGSWAEYTVQPNGDVVISDISTNLRLKGYNIQNGVLVRQ